MQNGKRNVDQGPLDEVRSNGNLGGGARVWMRMNMSARLTFLALAILCASAGAASAACSGAIGEFETIINSDAGTGNLNKGVYRKIVSELGSVKANCGAGRDAEASRALAAIKSRHGYR
jgi:hypothetical protein